MKHFLKRILLFSLIISLICSSLDINNKKVYAADPVTDIILTKVVLEMLAAAAVSYGIDNNISDELDEAFNGRLHDAEELDKVVLDKMELDEMHRLFIESQGAGYATWYYDEVYDKVVYSDGEAISSTLVDGVKQYLNPVVVDLLKKSGKWENVKKANNSFLSMSISSLYDASQSLKQNITEYQNKIAATIKSCLTMLAESMQKLKIDAMPKDGLTTDDVTQINNNQVIQALRYKSIPLTLKDDYGVDIRTRANTRPYYCMIKQNNYIEIFVSDTEMSLQPQSNAPNSLILYHGVASNYHYDTSKMTYLTWASYRTGSTGYILNQTVLFSNCTQIKATYNAKEFPYPLNSADTDTMVLEPTIKPVGVLKNIIDGILNVPAQGVIGLPSDDIKDILGDEVAGEYAQTSDPVVPTPTNAEKEYSDSVLGWLQRLFSVSNVLPSIYSTLAPTAQTVITGISNSFATTMDGLLKGKDEEGNPVYVPTLLGKIYDNLLDTPGILGGIKGLMEKLEEQVRTQAKAQEQARAEDKANDKAIADELTTALPSSGGGLFQLITSLIMILLMLLYLFLRCLEFIVLLFQVPSSTAFLTPGMVQGLNWLKTTKLIGHSDAKLTFNAVSQTNSIGLNITIWGFMIGIVNLLILFYIIRIIRKYIERMKG